MPHDILQIFSPSISTTYSKGILNSLLLAYYNFTVFSTRLVSQSQITFNLKIYCETSMCFPQFLSTRKKIIEIGKLVPITSHFFNQFYQILIKLIIFYGSGVNKHFCYTGFLQRTTRSSKCRINSSAYGSYYYG